MYYEHFRQDMRRTFALSLITDRFRDPVSGERSHVDYFRVLQRMRLAKSRQDTSTFYFDDLFLASLRSGYLKRLKTPWKQGVLAFPGCPVGPR